MAVSLKLRLSIDGYPAFSTNFRARIVFELMSVSPAQPDVSNHLICKLFRRCESILRCYIHSSMRNSIFTIKLTSSDRTVGHAFLEIRYGDNGGWIRLSHFHHREISLHSYVTRIHEVTTFKLITTSVTVLVVMSAKDSGLVASAGNLFSTLIDPVARQTPAANESRGDERLQEASKLAFEYESVIDANGRAAIEDRIT